MLTEQSKNNIINRLLLEEGHVSLDEMHNQQESQATTEELENSCVAMQCMRRSPSDYMYSE